MSDFGAMLLVFRKDNRNLTQDQYQEWERELTSIFQDQIIRNFLGEEIHPQAVESENDAGALGVSFIFSEYWIEEGEMDHKEMKEILDYDLAQIKPVIDAMRSKTDYQLDIYAGEW